MAILFASNSAFDFIGGMTQYTGSAEARDADYASEEIAALCTSNFVGGSFQTPNFTVAGDSVWLHFRVKFPTGADSTSADGSLVLLRTSNGTVIGGIDYENGGMRAQASTFTFGGIFTVVPGTVYTVDLLVDTIGGTDLNIEIYVNGSLASSASNTTNSAVPVYATFEMSDLLGVGSTNADAYFSEVIIDDTDSTIGCRLHTAVPNSAGTYAEMAGSVSDLVDAGDSAVLTATADGQRFSWNPPAYSGDISGVAVRAVIASCNVITAVNGPDKFTQFLRIGSTDYYGTQNDSGGGIPVFGQNAWTQDPSTVADWAIADMGDFEIGIRAEV